MYGLVVKHLVCVPWFNNTEVLLAIVLCYTYKVTLAITYIYVCVRACVFVCARVCVVCVCMRAYVRVRNNVRMRMYVCSIIY